MSSKRIGIFGGSFDPIHIGHLLIAEAASEQFSLDEVRFIPAAIAPHKQHRQPADAKHRIEMLRLAIGGNEKFVIDEREITRGGTSYTVETLRELKNELGAAELFFVMGADSLAEFGTWREPAEICKLAFMVVVARGGRSLPDLNDLKKFLPNSDTQPLENHLLKLPQLEISSTEIRRLAATGKSIRYQVPAAVAAYIHLNKVYAAEN